MSEVIKKAATNEVVEFLYGDLRERSAPVIFNSATGNPVVFNDGANGLPIKSLKVNFSPIQNGSGDPSPSNVRSIVPWNGLTVWNSGKNLISTGTVEFTRAKKYYFDKTFPAGTYTLSALVTSTDIDDSRCLARFWMNEDPVGSDIYFTRDSRKSKTITIEQPFNSIYLYASHSYIDADGDDASFADMQLEVGNIATDYESYHQITETDIEFPSSVYGGILNVMSGMLMVTHVLWTNNTANMDNESDYPGWKNSGIKNIVGAEKGGAIYTKVNVGNVFAVNTRNANDIVYLPKSEYVLIQDEWKALAIDIQIAVPLNEPQQVQLTPTQLQTLLGANTIWSDANGNIEVEYRADTGLFLKQNTVKDILSCDVSLLSNGIAIIPLANTSDANTAGLIKFGTGFWTNPSTGKTDISWAQESDVKSMTSSVQVPAVSKMPSSVFYGLAKAAGADMAQSSNAVGTYTDPAKTAIQKMFGFDGILGDYELSTTASKAYAIGETFIFNGNRYRATTAIAINDVLAPGTNCELDPLDGKYIRNTDIARSDMPGIVMIGAGLNCNASTGLLTVAKATDGNIKSGANTYSPIVPKNQHQSAFYGLAKAAGDTTQSQSDNAVGTYTAEAKAAILTMLGAVGESNYATTTSSGVVKVDPNYGTAMRSSPNENTIMVRRCPDEDIKNGNDSYRPLVPYTQHLSTFFGLSKAAGVNLANETVTVGTYPQTAKTAIQTMLGIEADIPLVETVTGATVSITGMPNVRYICETAISELTITPPASGSIVVRFTAGSNCIVSLPQTVKLPAWFDISSLEDGTTYEIIITDGVYGGVMSWA